MITHVKTKGFKGFDIDEDIHPKTLFIGKNKSGKSTRAAAIALAVLGYVPFAAKVNKKPAEILNDFGQGDKLTVSVICNDTELERHFSRSSKGTVSQRLRVDKNKVSTQDYAVALANAGGPQIIDVDAFMALSDQKKIDALFSLFPPKSDLKSLDSDIDKAKARVNKLQKDDQTAASTIQRLTRSKNEIELPAGTLAEIQADIEKTAEQVKSLQSQISSAESEEAREQGRESEREEIRKSREETQESLNKLMDQGGRGPEQKPDSKKEIGNADYYSEGPDPETSIKRILDALNDAGCGVCAAAMVAKQELKKFKSEVAA